MPFVAIFGVCLAILNNKYGEIVSKSLFLLVRISNKYYTAKKVSVVWKGVSAKTIVFRK